MPNTAEAIFAAGCFWGVEEVFRQTPGVLKTEVGYTGGQSVEPSYEEVCGGTTGHAEAVRVVYDPQIVSYRDLLKIFWANHDPTTRGRQGPDVGEQYRSAIFYSTPAEKLLAEEVKSELERAGTFPAPIVTVIQPLAPFYRAEEYHQQYLVKQGKNVCH